jgi:hypothetical protein
MFVERHEPPSDDPNVTTLDDDMSNGPIPDTQGLADEAEAHEREMENLFEAALDGAREMDRLLREAPPAAVPSADLSRQDPAAPAAEVQVSGHGAPAPIPVSVEPEPVTPTVEPEELRPCSSCYRPCRPTDFVGVTGRRTIATCNRCCVCVRRILSTVDGR